MREKILFDDNWLFHKGDINIDFPTDKAPTYVQSKTERKHWGPASRYYDCGSEVFKRVGLICTDKWENVNLPHDYIILQEPNKDENKALGFFKYENAWYRKKFILTEDDLEKRLTIFFEGVATHATIYVNGCLMKHNFCGYNSFEVNISDVAEVGENTLAVYVETHDHEGWWYEGGGIYRHVWLTKTEKVAVDLWGVYVRPEKIDSDKWQVTIETEVFNDKFEDVSAEIVHSVYDQDDKPVSNVGGNLDILLRDKNTSVCKTIVENPELWDIDRPYLYTVVTEIKVDGEILDTYKTRFGFRTFELNKDTGFWLNGRQVKIKGMCAHQDFGLTGKAVPDNIHRYKIELIKEMGANGFRTSHYPHSEATMDALDELGFIVLDETRWYESSDEGKEQLEMLVKRDRNRPSVFFWSVGNEEYHHRTEVGRRIYKNLAAFVKKLDDTRPVTTAVTNDPETAVVHEEVDFIGVNYYLDRFEKMRENFPDVPVISAECCATPSSRGWYFEDSLEKGKSSAYDKDIAAWCIAREKAWKFICEREWVAGEYQWIAFEHRGEAVWPRLCSISGAIDLFLQKKDAFYQNQSHWIEDRPIVHLLPHWNFAGLEGEIIKVWAYTNCDELELFLNGKSLGKKVIEKYGHGEWEVPYEPGTIRVEALKDGKVVCFEEKTTTGKAVKLNLKLDNKIEIANGKDIAVITCYCTDREGREVPDATPFVNFNSNSLGTIVGTGSDNADHNPVYETSRKMYAGRITVAVKVGNTTGDLKVYANTENLDSAVITIPLK